MKKFIKLILVLVLVGVIVFFGFSFLSNKINLKNIVNNIGNIIDNGNDKPVEDKTNGNSDFKNTSIAVDYNELSAKDKEEILPQIKSEIAKDDIENTYTKLFENKTYTNSNFKYELNKDIISFGSWVQFEKNFYTQFENAIARGENFLMYSTYNYNNSIHQKTGSTPLIYGYIDGLGYLIGIKNGNVLEFAIENKYYSKIITYSNSERPQSSWIRLDNTYDVLTLKSSQDIVKFPVGINDAKNETIYSDYKANIFKTTARGFFKDTHYWDFDYSDYQGYCFYEGNFMNITGKDKAYHLYGMGNYRVQTTKSMTYDENGDATYHADKDFEFFWSGDNLGKHNNNTKYMTDFNNFFVSFGQSQGNSYSGDVNYAMFGEVADVYLKQIVNLMFSSEIKECNDFENENDLKAKENFANSTQAMYVANSFEELFWTIEDEPSSGYKNNFFYPNDTETAKYYSKGEFLGNKEYDTAVPKKYTCNGKWYESLSEENKPYIISYVVFNDKLTIRHWKREWVGSTYYHIDLEENTIVLDEPVKETFVEFAHKLLDGKYTVGEYESGGLKIDYLIPDPEGRKPDILKVFLDELGLNEDITVVTDETNIFNKHYKTKTN